MRPELSINEQSFSQFVFENADFNTQTMDGYLSSHGRYSEIAILRHQNIERLRKMPTAKVVEDVGHIPLVRFERKIKS